MEEGEGMRLECALCLNCWTDLTRSEECSKLETYTWMGNGRHAWVRENNHNTR